MLHWPCAAEIQCCLNRTWKLNCCWPAHTPLTLKYNCWAMKEMYDLCMKQSWDGNCNSSLEFRFQWGKMPLTMIIQSFISSHLTKGPKTAFQLSSYLQASSSLKVKPEWLTQTLSISVSKGLAWMGLFWVKQSSSHSGNYDRQEPAAGRRLEAS